jgi:hypothetical protein
MGRSMTNRRSMTISLGDLVAGLCDAFESAYDDHELAAVATGSTLTELFGSGRAAFARFADRHPSASQRRTMNGQPRRAIEPVRQAA